MTSSAPDLGPTLYHLIEGMVRFLGIDQYSSHNTTQPKLLVDLMPEVYSRSSDALLRRLLSRRGFTAEHRRSLLRQVRERGSVYLSPINAVYVRQFRMTSAAEDATRFLHQACRGLPNLSNGKASGPQDASALRDQTQRRWRKTTRFTSRSSNTRLPFSDHASYIPARPAFRDADLAELFDMTREDLEHQTSLPFVDAVEALDFLTQHRMHDFRDSHRSSRRSCALESLAQAPAFTGRKYEYAAEQLGYLTGTDLYDAYIEGRLTTAALRKLFLTHIEQPGVARAAYIQLKARLRFGQRA